MAKRKTKPQKKKSNLLYILALGFIAVSAILFFLFSDLNKPVTLNDVTYYPVNIDRNRELVFSDANEIYRVRLDGSKPKKIGSFDRLIEHFDVLQNGDVKLSAGGRYLEEPKEYSETWKYDEDGKVVSDVNWIIRGDNKPEKLEAAEFNKYPKPFNTETYITNSLPDGGAEILLRKGDSLTKVGFLTSKIDYIVGCDGGGTTYYYPQVFNPSFNGDYLVGEPGGGGGTCNRRRSIISRDGNVRFDIKLGLSEEVIWIGDNKLILSSFSGADFITLNRDGTYKVEPKGKDFPRMRESQHYLSPSKEYIVIEGDTLISIYEIDSDMIIPLENTENFAFQNWIDDSNLIEFSSSDKESDTIIKVIYNLREKKAYKFASYPAKRSIRDNSPRFYIR